MSAWHLLQVVMGVNPQSHQGVRNTGSVSGDRGAFKDCRTFTRSCSRTLCEVVK